MKCKYPKCGMPRATGKAVCSRHLADLEFISWALNHITVTTKLPNGLLSPSVPIMQLLGSLLVEKLTTHPDGLDKPAA